MLDMIQYNFEQSNGSKVKVSFMQDIGIQLTMTLKKLIYKIILQAFQITIGTATASRDSYLEGLCQCFSAYEYTLDRGGTDTSKGCTINLMT